MKILVVNAGSSSLKYQLIDMETEKIVAKGVCERIGQQVSTLVHKGRGEKTISREIQNHTVAIKMVLDALVNKEYGAIDSMSEITAVGHRVVHSGEDYKQSVLIDDKVLEVCKKNSDFAPLHNPANIMGINACREVMSQTPMAAVFDNAFHSTIPDYAYLYAIPYEDYEEYRVRKYGFHGTSHKYVSMEAAAYLNKPIESLKLITCHLGNGASVAAVDGGKSVDTSMGFTPLEGLIMGTRSGDIDPAAVEFIMQKKGYNISDAINYLNKKSGVMGISGISSDFRDLTSAADAGNKRAQLAIDMFSYRVKKYIGAYAAAMGGVDAIVFTAGIGEHTPAVRERVLTGLEFLGVRFDNKLNYNVERGKMTDLSLEGARVKALLIPTNEELVIARETKQLLGGSGQIMG